MLSNILRICYNVKNNDNLEKNIKISIAASIGLKVKDLDFDDNKQGFNFIFDGESQGNLIIKLRDENGRLFIHEDNSDYAYLLIEADFDDEIVEIRELIINILND